MQYKIRKATKDDIPFIHQLIYELAEYEKLAHEVKTTVESMIEDGFGDDPLYEVFVATDQDTIIGIALFYYRYSTWRGRCLYLEDLVVTESYRGKGIGKLLMNALIEDQYFIILFLVTRDHEARTTMPQDIGPLFCNCVLV